MSSSLLLHKCSAPSTERKSTCVLLDVERAWVGKGTYRLQSGVPERRQLDREWTLDICRGSSLSTHIDRKTGRNMTQGIGKNNLVGLDRMIPETHTAQAQQ